jgi:hypothetical protein
MESSVRTVASAIAGSFAVEIARIAWQFAAVEQTSFVYQWPALPASAMLFMTD